MEAAVRGIADDGVPDRAQVDANLVCPSCGDRDLEERDTLEMPGGRHARDGAPRAPRPRGHLLTLRWIPPDRRIDAPAGACYSVSLLLLLCHLYFKACDAPPPQGRRKLAYNRG